MPHRFQRGPVTVTLDDGFERFAARGRDRARGAALRRLQLEVQPVLNGARAGWPIKTGRSWGGLGMESEGGQRPTVAIADPVSYTLRVHGGDSWEILVRVPMRLAMRRVLDRVPGDVADALRGG